MTPLDLARKAIADYDTNSTTWSAKELIEIIRGLVNEFEEFMFGYDGKDHDEQG